MTMVLFSEDDFRRALSVYLADAKSAGYAVHIKASDGTVMEISLNKPVVLSRGSISFFPQVESSEGRGPILIPFTAIAALSNGVEVSK
jgi:hypothetical protein